MNPLDFHVAQVFSSYASHHQVLDWKLEAAAGSYVLKGQVLMAMYWWAWFLPRPDQRRAREALVAALLACVMALAVGRVLVTTLPYRARPIDNPTFHYNLPYPVDHSDARDWSSFPSDHAILFVGLAAGIFCAWRLGGVLALLYVAVVVCFPRIYLGYHYLSDILAGAAIGIGLVALFNWQNIRRRITQIPLRWHEARPQVFYVVLLLLSYEIAELFGPLRHLLGALRGSAKIGAVLLHL
jgi:undecaprenyl-diphosphatase